MVWGCESLGGHIKQHSSLFFFFETNTNTSVWVYIHEYIILLCPSQNRVMRTPEAILGTGLCLPTVWDLHFG